MRITAQQTRTRTIADLIRAMDRKHAVTITYLKAGETEPTIRTIEVHDLRTSAAKVDGLTVTEGDIMVIAMCRLRGEEREFAVGRILIYTLHRIANVMVRPEPTVYVRQAPAPTHSVEAIVAYELARSQDDADYIPRQRLDQTTTALAA
jgi:predicted DNA-binding transcriptional regulator YafY